MTSLVICVAKFITSRNVFLNVSKMSKFFWILLFYILIITFVQGDISLPLRKNGLVVHLESNPVTNCTFSDTETKKLFHNKIRLDKKNVRLKFYNKLGSFQYPVENNNYVSRTHIRNKRDSLDWLDDLRRRQRAEQERIEQVEQQRQEQQRRQLVRKAAERQARETFTIFTLLGILIVIGIIICVICKRATHKFERNSREIQNVIVTQGNSQRNEEVINTSEEDDDDDVLRVNNDLIDLPPSYEEAVANRRS